MQSDFDQLLACATPHAWIDAAVHNQGILLVDHANCERKAAATALKLMFQYGERLLDTQVVLSRLAREELRHFEQVRQIMKKRGIPPRILGASRYAQGLRRHTHRHEPDRMTDILIISAMIEARSCERFRALAPHLDTELSEFYGALAEVEARHFEIYLKLADQFTPGELAERIGQFSKIEAELITNKDREFRFHSGPLS